MEQKTIATAAEAAYKPPRKQKFPVFEPGTPVAKSLPIAPTLKALMVGESAVFPIEQYSSLQTTVNRFHRIYSRQGWTAQLVANEEEFTATVTRTA